jgi:transposase-like protein
MKEILGYAITPNESVSAWDRAEILGDFKMVHRQETKEAAAKVLSDFADKWKKTYPKVIEMLQGTHTSSLFTIIRKKSGA